MAKGISGSVQLFAQNTDKSIDEVLEAMPVRTKSEVLMDIPLSLIRPDPDQPRTEKTEEDLDALYQRILATGGITKPIDVKPDPENEGQFLIEDGECRWIVYNTRYKQDTIPSRVINKSRADHEVLLRQLMANIGGIDMSIVDIATGLQTWMKKFDPPKGNKEAAIAFGWSETKVSRTLKVLKAPDFIQQHIKEANLSNINTISSMVNLHKLDPVLFERCLEETQAEDFQANPEHYWRDAYREASQPPPEKPQPGADVVTEDRSNNSTNSTTGLVENENRGQEGTRPEPKQPAKKTPKSEIITPTDTNIVESGDIAVLQISYLVGNRTLMSEYELTEDMQRGMFEKLANLLNIKE